MDGFSFSVHLRSYNYPGFLIEYNDSDSEEYYYDSEEEDIYFDQLDDASQPVGAIEEILDQPDDDEDVNDQLLVEESIDSEYEDSYDIQDDAENFDLQSHYIEDLSYHDVNDVPEDYDGYTSDSDADYWENYENYYENSSYYLDSDDYFSD